MSIARRLKSAEAHLPKPPDSAAEKLRRRLSSGDNAAFFSGVFGSYEDYVAAKHADRDGALAVAELVNQQTDGVAGVAYLGLSLDVVTEAKVIRLQELLQTSHEYTELAIVEIREILFSALPVDYGFPRGQKYCN